PCVSPRAGTPWPAVRPAAPRRESRPSPPGPAQIAGYGQPNTRAQETRSRRRRGRCRPGAIFSPGDPDASRDCARCGPWREPSIAPPAGGAPQTFRVTHPFHPLRGRVFPLIECRQTWGEYRVFFQDDAGQLARLPRQWTDLIPDDPTVIIGAGRAHFRYDD